MLKIVSFYILVHLIHHYHQRTVTPTKHWRLLKIEKLQKQITAVNFEPIINLQVPTLPRRKVFLNITMKYTHPAPELIHWEHLAEKPTFSWKCNKTDYYTLFFTQTRPDYDAMGYYQYHNWIVVNILGIDVFNGQEILRYKPPMLYTGAIRAIYKMFVYKQPGRMIFDEYGKSFPRTFTTHEKFALKYNLGSPIAGWMICTEDLRNYTRPTTTTYWTPPSRKRGTTKSTIPTIRITYRARRRLKLRKDVALWPLCKRVRQQRRYWGLSTKMPFC